MVVTVVNNHYTSYDTGGDAGTEVGSDAVIDANEASAMTGSP